MTLIRMVGMIVWRDENHWKFTASIEIQIGLGSVYLVFCRMSLLWLWNGVILLEKMSSSNVWKYFGIVGSDTSIVVSKLLHYK